MAIITGRGNVERIMERMRDKTVSLAIFCTASHWNTEAILLAAKRFSSKHGVSDIPIAVAMTYNYDYCPQAQRITYSRDAKTGFLSIMSHLYELCNRKDSPYNDVCVLPHLDHADFTRDHWALTEGLDYLATVMFDAQKYPYQENVEMTRNYVNAYRDRVLIEGIMDEISVKGFKTAVQKDDYADRASKYVRDTAIDFLVADLGTEQQSSAVGDAKYLSDRARAITRSLGKPRLVLHGTSCLSEDQFATIPQDGVIRVNMWTRIAREAGLYAAQCLENRMNQIRENQFEAIESRQYIYDCTEKAAEIMEDTLLKLGYGRLA